MWRKLIANGWTPLACSTINGHFEVVHYLLDRWASRNKADNRGWTPLHWAALRGHLNIAKLLMAYERT